MASLADLLAIHTDLPGRAARHLQRIAGEWQLLADLSFADLRLWVRNDPEGDTTDPAYICIAQCRPNTTSTVYDSDGVGVVVPPWEAPTLHAAFEGGVVVRGVTPAWTGPATPWSSVRRTSTSWSRSWTPRSVGRTWCVRA